MADKILNAFDVWITAQGVKSRTRLRSVDNVNCEGVAKLRELILELAIKGELVPREEEVTANDLLDKLANGKKNLVAKYELRNYKVLPEVDANDIPFDVPKGWIWIRLGNIGFTQTGGTPDKNDKSYFGDDIPFIKPGDIFPKHVDYSNEGLSKKGAEKLGRIAPENSILMVCIGTIGKCNYIERPCAFNQQINSLTPFIDITKYLLVALQSNYFQDMLWQKSSSTTIAILNKGKWENCFIPLPPLAEQHRIVAKVDELMSLCDELEREETNHLKSHQLLVQTLLGTLTQAKDASDFQQAWNRLYEHFDDLFTTEDSIEQLKQTILQLAVIGKLVPQDPNDEPASQLLKKIAKEKERLVEEGKIKKQKAYEEELEMSSTTIPETWSLVKCQDISLKITDGEHATPNRSDSGHYLLSARNVTNEGIILDDVDFVPAEEFNRIRKRCDPNIGDILISCSGSVGRVASVDKDNAYAMVRSAAMIRTSSTLAKEYIVLVLKSPQLQSQIKSKSKQSAQANLFLGAISELILPIAPFNEQKRIVAKVNELFALCDRLKERIAEAQKVANQMAEGVVAQLI